MIESCQRSGKITGLGVRAMVCPIGAAIVLSLLLTAPLHAQFRYVDAERPRKGGGAILPFAFYTHNIEFAVGGAWLSRGQFQDQMALTLAGYGSTNGSWGIPLLGNNIQMPCGERLFLNFTSFFARYDNFDAYRDGNPDFPLERSGGNKSSDSNLIAGRGRQYFIDPTFRYVLPVGSGADSIIHTYAIDEGLVVDNPFGGGPWNPLAGGRSYVEITPFYRSENVESGDLHDTRSTNGLHCELIYDNRDVHSNPSRGSRQSVSVTRDWGLFDSSDSWTNLETDLSKYFPLPRISGTRQQVLAFNFWTSYTPTWKQVGTDAAGKPVFRRPPEFKGARLGGFFRMRAFRVNRFSDKAAVYYAAEYRVIPDWNPLGSISLLDWLRIKWMQVVLFAEVGRVAPSWRLDELHRDMQWDAGLGLRLWGRNTVVRADMAFAEQSSALAVMLGHPF